MRAKRLLNRSFLVAPVALAAAALSPAPAGAECRVATVQFTPEANMQIAVWLEDPQGNFIDTLFVTRATGTYGLANRPGRADFNTNYLWVYGRREMVLPVWAHRQPAEYPLIVFQNNAEDQLSHPADQSSVDPYYCAPQSWTDPDVGNGPDVTTCATPYTGSDKGMFSPTLKSKYPPRNDLPPAGPFDSPDVDMYASLNQLDAVSRATPAGGQPFQVLASLDPNLPDGDYVVWIEVSRERDYNDMYNPSSMPPPKVPFQDWGDPVRGQPSVVWKVPVTLGASASSGQTATYVGYGDPDGLSGTLNPPDSSINGVAGSYTIDLDGAGSRPPTTFPTFGEARLQLVSGPDGMYRVRVDVTPSDDVEPPGAPGAIGLDALEGASATLSFASPGDDGQTGTPTEYEIRYSVGTPLSAANFDTGMLVAEGTAPVVAGQIVSFTLPNLLPETHYYVGVRAKDDCLIPGDAAFFDFTTAAATGGEVDACFVATAAWGSLMATQVEGLRGFRDRALRTQALGELAVEAYYTFAPALAELIEPSDTLRALARAGLSPLVDAAAPRE